MKNFAVSLAVIVTLLVLWSLPAVAAAGFSGTIIFRDGEQLHFDHLGNEHTVYQAEIRGKSGSREVSLQFADLRQIIFTDPVNYYGGSTDRSNRHYNRGTVMIVNRQGKRFTLEECEVGTSHPGVPMTYGRIRYTFLDPITGERRSASAAIRKTISQITIGPDRGRLKINRKTGEYFPAMYIYDPFTGARLEWDQQ